MYRENLFPGSHKANVGRASPFDATNCPNGKYEVTNRKGLQQRCPKMDSTEDTDDP